MSLDLCPWPSRGHAHAPISPTLTQGLSVPVRLGRTGQMSWPNARARTQNLSASCPSGPISGANLGRICVQTDTGRTRTCPFGVRPWARMSSVQPLPTNPIESERRDGPACQPPSRRPAIGMWKWIPGTSGKNDHEAGSSSGSSGPRSAAGFSISPPAATPRHRPYIKVEVCRRYWDTATPLPWSDAHLPNG